jgi:hypothetical protein
MRCSSQCYIAWPCCFLLHAHACISLTACCSQTFPCQRHHSQKVLSLSLVRVRTRLITYLHSSPLHRTMANNYGCAPARVEVPSPGLTTANTNAAVPTGSTPTNAHLMASYSPMANGNVPEFNASHMSSITADGVHDYSHWSAITAGSEHDPPTPPS